MSLVKHVGTRGFVLMLIALTVSACSTGFGTTSANEWTLVGVGPDDTNLLVSTSLGGVAAGCSRFEDWSVEETENSVEIVATVWNELLPDSCTEELVTELYEIELAAPLGDRELLGCERNDCREITAGDRFSLPTIAAASDLVAITTMGRTETFDQEGEAMSVFDVGLDNEVFIPEDTTVAVGIRDQQTIAVDLESGEVVWQSTGIVGDLIDGVAYLCGGQDEDRSVAGIDAQTGEQLWVAPVSCGFVTAHGDVATIVGFESDVDGENSLTVLDARTGEIEMDELLFDGIDDQVQGLDGAVGAASMTVTSGTQSNLVVLNGNGDEVYRQAEGIGQPVAADRNMVILESRGGLTGWDVESREIVWDVTAELAFTDGGLFIHDAAASTLERIDAQTGEIMWSAPLPLSAAVRVASSHERIYVLTHQALVALDRNTGELRWDQHQPLFAE